MAHIRVDDLQDLDDEALAAMIQDENGLLPPPGVGRNAPTGLFNGSVKPLPPLPPAAQQQYAPLPQSQQYAPQQQFAQPPVVSTPQYAMQQQPQAPAPQYGMQAPPQYAAPPQQQQQQQQFQQQPVYAPQQPLQPQSQYQQQQQQPAYMPQQQQPVYAPQQPMMQQPMQPSREGVPNLSPTSVAGMSAPGNVSPNQSAGRVVSREADPRLKSSGQSRAVDVCFCVDCTISMKHWIAEVKNKVVAIAAAIRQYERVSSVRLAFVGYRDYFFPERFVVFPFTDNWEQFARSVQSVEAQSCPGNDEPEDLLGGLDQALKLQWQSRTRILVLIADAPCHGKDYHDLQDSPNNARFPDPLKADTLLRAMSGPRFNIDLTFCRIHPDTDKMIAKFSEHYKNPAANRKLVQISLDEKVDNFLPQIVKTIQDSVKRSS